MLATPVHLIINQTQTPAYMVTIVILKYFESFIFFC